MSVIDALKDACGEANAREADRADTVGGVAAGWVAVPGDADELAAVLRVAAQERLTVVPSGAGSKLDWGATPARVDVLIELGRLAGVYDHDARNELATIGAGTPLRAVRAALARAGQRLSLDVGSPGATFGGVLATEEAGPLRLAFGPPSDLVVGVRAGLADGSLVRQLPGLDVPRLMCGSFGTLGVVAEATVRVHPIPPARAWVVRPVATPRDVHELTYALLASSFAPVAIEADLPGGPASGRPSELAVLVEGSVAGARTRAAAIARILGGGASVEDTPPDWWGRYPFGPAGVALKITARSSELFAVIYALRDAAGAPVPVRGSAGVGVAYAALPDTMAPGRIDGVLAAARSVLLGRGGGACTVLRAPATVRDSIDLYGPMALAMPVRQAKAALDPEGRLSPGRAPLT